MGSGLFLTRCLLHHSAAGRASPAPTPERLPLNYCTLFCALERRKGKGQCRVQSVECRGRREDKSVECRGRREDKSVECRVSRERRAVISRPLQLSLTVLFPEFKEVKRILILNREFACARILSGRGLSKLFGRATFFRTTDFRCDGSRRSCSSRTCVSS